MPQNFKLKRFSNVAVLKRIDPGLLMQFLGPFKTFLVDQRGINWPDDPGKFDYAALAKILMSPSVDTPDELLDALYFVDNSSDGECYDRILSEAQEAGIEIGNNDPTPEDLALRVWLADRNILERVHAEQYRTHPKRFESFFSNYAVRPNLEFPSDKILLSLEFDLDEWYAFKKKGRGAKVFPFPKEDGVWFLVRHGQRIKREGTVEAGGDSGSVFYRPEKFDVLIYYPERGELAIYAETKGELKNYCRLFGKHLFGDEDFFRFKDSIAKYTLNPLIGSGRDALVCTDVEGIKHIRLYELQYMRNSDQRNRRTIWGDDVLADLELNGPDLQEEVGSISLLKAKFKVTFAGGRQRSVSIEPPNIASFDRETDNSMVHDWLSKQKFILTVNAEGQEHVESDVVLEMV